jgi:hypothetical protein
MKSLHAKVLAIGHMSKTDVTRHISAHTLTFCKNIYIKKAQDEYCKLADSNKWPPAHHATDSNIYSSKSK